MIYPDNFERKIGFTEIRTQLKGRCMSALGIEWVDKHLQFMTDAARVRQALAECAEYVRFDQEHGDEVESEFFDVREALLHIRPDRTYMEEPDLFNLKRSLRSAVSYRLAFTSTTDGQDDSSATSRRQPASGGVGEEGPDDEADDAGDNDETQTLAYNYPALAAMSQPVATFPALVDRIDSVLNKY